MKTASVILTILYCALMIATLFVKNEKLKLTKSLAIFGSLLAIVHTALYFVAQSHWSILLASLTFFLIYAIANGLLMKKAHILHWIVRLIISAAIFVLFII